MSETTTNAVETNQPPRHRLPLDHFKTTKVEKTSKKDSTKAKSEPKANGDQLRKPQVRILKALAKEKNPVSLSKLADKAEVNRNVILGLTGSATAEARARIEAYHGYKSLLTRKMVKCVEISDTDIPVGDRRLFEITPLGRKALAASNS
jgi:hypothetical protein